MVLVDTSVWVSHFRKAHDGLVEIINNGEAVESHTLIYLERKARNGFIERRVIATNILSAGWPIDSEIDH